MDSDGDATPMLISRTAWTEMDRKDFRQILNTRWGVTKFEKSNRRRYYSDNDDDDDGDDDDNDSEDNDGEEGIEYVWDIGDTYYGQNGDN
jgi:hypothetical protein